MFSEDDLLPLSGLQHMSFCERRWALIHIEQIWADNRFTAEGNELHEKAHSGSVESRPGVLIRRTVPLHSFHLGLSGQADVIEFHPAGPDESGVALPGRRGLWRPYPIEYKRSKEKAGGNAYRVQLCAQALCLEEMLGVAVPEGAIFDGSAKRRSPVRFDAQIREMVRTLAFHMHELFRQGATPGAVFKKGCLSCSLREKCYPEATGSARSMELYYRRHLKEDAN
jgi:CRISPR-associated exonuclease Cas4